MTDRDVPERGGLATPRGDKEGAASVTAAFVNKDGRYECKRCGETWDRHSSTAVEGHVCAHRDLARAPVDDDDKPKTRRLYSAVECYREACAEQGRALRSLARQTREAIDALAFEGRWRDGQPDRDAMGPPLAKLGGVERALLAIAAHLEVAGAK